MTFNDGQNEVKFIGLLQDLVALNTLFKITFSKPRPQNKEIINLYIKPAMIKKELLYSFTYSYKTSNDVKNYTGDQFIEMLPNLLEEVFFNSVIFTETQELTLLQSKKGVSTLLSKNVNHILNIEKSHDHQKIRPISESSLWLKDVGLTGKNGKLLDKSHDKYRQINKYIEILSHILSEFQPDQVISIADMGCGKGYLTFALYDYLVNIKKVNCLMTGYELRQDLVTYCCNVAAKNNFIGLTFQQKSIQDADISGVDVVIALHACDVSTDMAIAKGIQSGAKYIIVAPCCHKQIRLSMKHNNDLSSILKNGILEERQAELITDGIRALMLEGYGYKAQVFEFVSMEHTAKNIMITAVKKSENKTERFTKVEKIKELFGIDYHYLQKSMEDWETKRAMTISNEQLNF